MKTGKKIINIFLAFLITILIIANFIVHTFKTTTLDEKYVINLLEEKEYYQKVEVELANKFEEYQYQSGLSEEIFSNLYTSDMIKNDINSIIHSVYEGADVINSSETIRNQLETNINQYLQNNNIYITEAQIENINEFEDLVVKAYEDNITISSDTVKQIYNIKEKINTYIVFIRIGLIVTLIVLVLILLIFNVHAIWEFCNMLMISLLSSGILLKLAVSIITKNIDVDNIVLLTQLLSDFIKEIIQGIFSNISTYSTVLIVIGIAGIIFSNYKKIKD